MSTLIHIGAHNWYLKVSGLPSFEIMTQWGDGDHSITHSQQRGQCTNLFDN